MLKFRVEYYDDDDQKKLSALSCAHKINEIVHNGASVPEQELFAYSVFREQKFHHGWRTYKDLVRLLPSRIEMFEDYFELGNGKIVSKFVNSDDTDIRVTESAGIGASLSLVSQFYGLTEADWEKIPVSSVKDLDFQVAATEKEIIEVEAKGAITENTLLKSEVSQRATHIREKKIAQRETQGNKNTLIGVIVSVPKRKEQDVVCRLLDPDGEDLGITAEKYKLLARLHFYYREIRTVSRSHFLIALINRIVEIQNIQEYQNLNQTPLLNIDGEPFDIPSSLRISRSIAGNDFAFGEIVPLGNNEFYYYGFVFSIVNLLLKQNFSAIMRYSETPRNLGDLRITASIRKSELETFGIGKDNLPEIKGNYYHFEMRGILSVTSAGRVIGRCRFINR